MVFDFEFAIKIIKPVLACLPVTLALTFWSIVFSLIMAVIFGGIILKDIPVLKQLVQGLTSFIKGVPLVVQMYFCYYALPYMLKNFDGILFFHFDLRDLPLFQFAVVAFTLNYGAYITDIVVSSMRGVEHGQTEACYAVGMKKLQTLMRVVIPQAIVISIPNMSNMFTALLKSTSMVFLINIMDILGKARQLAGEAYTYLEAYVVSALIYWVIFIIVDKAMVILEIKCGKFNTQAKV